MDSDDSKYEEKECGNNVLNKKSNVLPIWGNERTMNLNPLILTNIQSSHYFKVNLYELKTYHEVIDEIYYKVSHLEPWEKGSRKTAGQTGMCGGVRGVGAGGIVSTAYCLLYKLFTLKLSRKQVIGLITHPDSPYIRVLGFMYIRYTQPPADLYDWYSDYLEDQEELDVKAGSGQIMSIGNILKNFLCKLEWFSTLFPRIPVPIQQKIEQRLSERFPPLVGSSKRSNSAGASRQADDDRHSKSKGESAFHNTESRERSEPSYHRASNTGDRIRDDNGARRVSRQRDEDNRQDRDRDRYRRRSRSVDRLDRSTRDTRTNNGKSLYTERSYERNRDKQHSHRNYDERHKREIEDTIRRHEESIRSRYKDENVDRRRYSKEIERHRDSKEEDYRRDHSRRKSPSYDRKRRSSEEKYRRKEGKVKTTDDRKRSKH